MGFGLKLQVLYIVWQLGLKRGGCYSSLEWGFREINFQQQAIQQVYFHSWNGAFGKLNFCSKLPSYTTSLFSICPECSYRKPPWSSIYWVLGSFQTHIKKMQTILFFFWDRDMSFFVYSFWIHYQYELNLPKKKMCILKRSLQLCSTKQSNSQLLSHSINKFFSIQIMRPHDPT